MILNICIATTELPIPHKTVPSSENQTQQFMLEAKSKLESESDSSAGMLRTLHLHRERRVCDFSPIAKKIPARNIRKILSRTGNYEIDLVLV